MLNNKETKKQEKLFEERTFGYDLNFLKDKDCLIILSDGEAQVIVSPKYQGKVFISTAAGLSGMSFIWIF